MFYIGYMLIRTYASTDLTTAYRFVTDIDWRMRFAYNIFHIYYLVDEGIFLSFNTLTTLEMDGRVDYGGTFHHPDSTFHGIFLSEKVL